MNTRHFDARHFSVLTLRLLIADSEELPLVSETQQQLLDLDSPPQLLLDAFGVKVLKPTREYPPYEPFRDISKLLEDSLSCVSVYIHAVDDSFRRLDVSLEMTSAEVLLYYLEQIDCNCPDYFALSSRDSLPGTDDYLDVWLPSDRSLRSLDIQAETHLYVKVKFFKSPSYELDPIALDLFYMQTRLDIIHGRHLVSDSTALLLASIELQIARGNFISESELLGSPVVLSELFPPDHRKGSTREQWLSRISRVYRRLYGLSSTDAKWCYLQVARQIPTFGASFFTVYQGALRVTLAIVEDGILAFKEDDRTVADYTCFLDIIDWYPARTSQGITLRILKPQETDSPDAIEIRVTYSCSTKSQLIAIIQLLDGYQGLYFALHSTSRQSTLAWQHVLAHDSDRVKSIRSEQVRRQTDVDPRLYLHSARRTFSTFQHDSDYLIYQIRRLCAIHGTNIFAPLLSQIDKTVLFALSPLTRMDLSRGRLTCDELEPIAHALEKFLEDPQRGVAETAVSLEEIDLNHNGLGADVLHLFLRSALAAPIKILRLGGNSVKPDDLDMVFKSFKPITFEYLSHLDFSANALTDKRAARLYETLSQCLLLTHLDLSENKLVSCEGISVCFKQKTKFESLCLRGNKINDGGLEAICGAIKRPHFVLGELDVRSNDFGRNGLASLISLLRDGTTVVNSLLIAGNEVSKSLISLADASTSVNMLRHISLAGDIPPTRFSDFLSAISSSAQSSLSSLAICGTCDKGIWPILGKFLVDSKKVTSLSLRNNPSAPSGLSSLVQHIRKGSSLRKLDLADSGIGKKDIAVFPDLIAHCHLQVLDLSHNKVSDELASVIGSALMYSDSLLELVLVDSQLSTGGVIAILSALQKTCKLFYLNAAKNAITSLAVGYLTSFVRSETGLGLLDLRDNPIHDGDAESIRDLLLVPHNCTLLLDP
eukprot:TRINITY_DN1718_c0_g1_i1.p1 TRINITY_DN1718_c0_g1~~TRINITY_DN1718_c0_g1_i1.p1  ORF type:complete len:938 (-),score=70.71 TRINITY_DN1718_c0_g1_i1:125-2938(-)